MDSWRYRTLNKYIYTAALVLLTFGVTAPQARAASTVFSLTSGGALSGGGSVFTYSGGGFTLTLTGYTCRDSQGNNVTLCDSVDTSTKNTTQAQGQSNTMGLGLTNDSQSGTDEIPRNEFIQVDFSAVPANTTITSITFTMTDLVDGWDIYQSSVAGEFDSSAGGPVAQGNNGGVSLLSFPNIASTVAGNGLSGSSTIITNSAGFFNVTALQSDCEAALSSVTVNFSTSVPEPATCMLMGIALLGLGLTGKKLRARSR